MRGVYTAIYKIIGLTSTKTLMYIVPSSGKLSELLYISITNANNSINQQLECSLARITTLGSPTATSVTPTPTEPSDQIATSSVFANCTSEPTTYGPSLSDEGAPSLGGWFWEPAANRTIIATNTFPCGIRLIEPSSPASFDCLINLTFREIG